MFLIFKIIGVQNQLHISFCTALVCNKISNTKILPQHTRISNLRFLVAYEIRTKSDTKIVFLTFLYYNQ